MCVCMLQPAGVDYYENTTFRPTVYPSRKAAEVIVPLQLFPSGLPPSPVWRWWWWWYRVWASSSILPYGPLLLSPDTVWPISDDSKKQLETKDLQPNSSPISVFEQKTVDSLESIKTNYSEILGARNVYIFVTNKNIYMLQMVQDPIDMFLSCVMQERIRDSDTPQTPTFFWTVLNCYISTNFQWIVMFQCIWMI